jgi:hypothetical protein
MNIFDKGKMLVRLLADNRHPKVFSFHDSLPDVFSSYLELLMIKRFRILSAQELMERLSLNRTDEKNRTKEAVLTFDDGRRNCWTVIFPLLKKYKIKAIFFVIPERIQEAHETYPNLEDYWKGKVSWENLYLTHRKIPYLTWKELEIMQQSGLVEVFSHSMSHEVVPVSTRVIDFQHPGVYEMPVYFDEWFQNRMPSLECVWGAPIYERSWAPLTSNAYVPNASADVFMNEFVKKNGDYLFFKKKDWRKLLFEFYEINKKKFSLGHFRRLDNKEDAYASVVESKKIIEKKLSRSCFCFSLPLYQSNLELFTLLKEAGYKIIFDGPERKKITSVKLFLLNRFPSFWIKFLAYI